MKVDVISAETNIPVSSVNEKIGAVFCHLSILTGLVAIVPMVFTIWTDKKKNPFLHSHASQALRFQLAILMILICTFAMGIALFTLTSEIAGLLEFLVYLNFILIGAVAVAIAIAIYAIPNICMACVAAMRGKEYSYSLFKKLDEKK